MKFKPVFTRDEYGTVRLFRLVGQRGKPGIPGGGYSWKFSVGLHWRAFFFRTGWHEWFLTLLGIRMHYQRSYGGVIP